MLFFTLFFLSVYNLILAFFTIPMLVITILICGSAFIFTANNKDYESIKDLIYFMSLYTIMYSMLLIFIKYIVSIL